MCKTTQKQQAGGLATVAMGMLLAMLCNLAASYAAGVILARYPVGETACAALRAGAALVSLLPVAIYFVRKRKAVPFASLQKGRRWAFAFPLFIGAGLVMNIAINGLRAFFFAVQPTASRLPQGVPAVLLWFLATVAIPAVLEEGIFRDGVLPLLADGYGPGQATLFSALLFAIMHTSVWELPVVMVLGLLLGWFAVKGASLWLCIGLHFANNTLAFMLAYAGKTFSPMPVLLAALLLVAIGMAGLRSKTTGQQQKRQAYPSLLRQREFWLLCAVAGIYYISRAFF